jgi:hypothetical protein
MEARRLQPGGAPPCDAIIASLPYRFGWRPGVRMRQAVLMVRRLG